MYLFLKKIARTMLPQRFLFRAEPFLRSIYAFFFRGDQFHCTICGGTFRKYLHLKNGELLCVRCGSLPRDRRLFDLLQKENLLRGKVLDFSPSRALYRKLRKTPGIDYISSDFEDEFISDHRFDITAIELPDHFADLVICYHILEHVPDDKKAMAELYRVLKPGGIMLQTPFREGEIFEDPAITSDEGRLENFGQKDHVRIYSVDGISDRLGQAGFIVNVLSFNDQSMNRSGFSEKEIVLCCKKLDHIRNSIRME